MASGFTSSRHSLLLAFAAQLSEDLVTRPGTGSSSSSPRGEQVPAKNGSINVTPMPDNAQPPALLFLVGAPAVGKMTVGREIAARTGLRLFHNHMSIDMVLPFFDYGTPSFTRLVETFRMSVFEEVAASSLPGLIFTFVWAFNLPSEDATIAKYSAPFVQRGGRVLFAELEASLEERLRRNKTELRLTEKPSKRDVHLSEKRLLEHEQTYTFTSGGRYDSDPSWMRLDITHLSPRDAGDAIIERFSL